MTFFIALFIILMQFLWKYIDDLVGKGLGWDIIAQLLFYASATFVPLALPLAVLLSSLMTFGNLGEHFELVALKSSGVSLQKFMMPLIIFIVVLCITAFYFSNNILPIANLKMGSLLYDVREQKPALNIKEGIYYNGIDNYVIKVGKKEKDGISVHNIMIYDHSARQGNINLTYGKSGRMETTPDEKYLIFTLFDGFNYSEKIDSRERSGINPFQRIRFDEQIRKLDLSSFALNRTSEEFFKDNFQMLNLNQLESAIDTLELALNEKYREVGQNIESRYYFFNTYNTDSNAVSLSDTFNNSTSSLPPETQEIITPDTPKHPSIRAQFERQLRQAFPKKTDSSAIAQNDSLKIDTLIVGNSILKAFTKNEQKRIIDNALLSARNNKDFTFFAGEDMYGRQRVINRHKIEWHRKFSLSFACLILFFIGAPLGAIIRKGGFGLPVVISVLFFVIYHVISITGEKMVRQGTIPAYEGMWIASLVLFPIGIFLTIKATSDSPLFDMDTYIKVGRKISHIFKRKIS